jgi:antitoxin (DNA-binding transcriptional repressor) of toxin-antitoxin stability system
MVTTLKEGQQNLPRLVELASNGEDVVITVDGKPRAKLTRAESPVESETLAADRDQWLKELQELRQKYATGKNGLSVEQMLEQDRADRV